MEVHRRFLFYDALDYRSALAPWVNAVSSGTRGKRAAALLASFLGVMDAPQPTSNRAGTRMGSTMLHEGRLGMARGIGGRVRGL